MKKSYFLFTIICLIHLWGGHAHAATDQPPVPPVVLEIQSATASSEWNRDFSAAKAVDGDSETRWGAAAGSTSGWLEVDLGDEKEIDAVRIVEAPRPRVQAFSIAIKVGDEWKVVQEGARIEGGKPYSFPPVRARFVRLNISKASEVPTIFEFEVLGSPGQGQKKPKAQVVQTSNEKLSKRRQDQKMQWFRDAKFGMFVTWGPYSVAGGFWSKDNTFASRFDGDDSNLVRLDGYAERLLEKTDMPLKEYVKLNDVFDWSKWNAKDVIDLCYATGQRYIVITTKYHDGFAMWRSKASKFNITEGTPYGRNSGRDPLKELADACTATQDGKHPWPIKLCVYYSHCADWYEPYAASFGYDLNPPQSKEQFQEYLDTKVKPQLKELLTEYGDIGLIWFDTPREMPPDQAQALKDFIQSMDPDVLINGRLGAGVQGNYMTCGDNGIAGTPVYFDWEGAGTVNHSWGYHRDDHDWRDWETLAELLVKCVSRNGNYLLNIGPKADGTIPQKSIDILHAFGAWVKPHSEAIFGAKSTPYKGDKAYAHDWGYCTQKDNNLYLFVKSWPGDNILRLPLVKNRITDVSYLVVDKEASGLPFQRTPNENGNTQILIPLPENPRVEGMTVLKVTFSGKELALEPVKHAYDQAEKQITLDARNFEVRGYFAKATYDREKKAIHIWVEKNRRVDQAVWTLDVPEAGDYSVELLYSSQRNLSSGKTVDILINDQKALSFTTSDTKTWDNYEPHTVGSVRLEKGKQEFIIHPRPRIDGQGGWSPSLKTVKLIKSK